MKINRTIMAIIFLLSLSFNAAFLLHLFTRDNTGVSPAETAKPPVKLNLTEQQIKQMEPIRAKIHRENEAIKKQINQCQEKLLTALKKEPIDKQAIFQCIDNINQLQKKIQQNTVEEIIHIRGYMNPDQCSCLIEGLGAAMNQAAKPCNCPHCQSHQE